MSFGVLTLLHDGYTYIKH